MCSRVEIRARILIDMLLQIGLDKNTNLISKWRSHLKINLTLKQIGKGNQFAIVFASSRWLSEDRRVFIILIIDKR